MHCKREVDVASVFMYSPVNYWDGPGGKLAKKIQCGGGNGVAQPNVAILFFTVQTQLFFQFLPGVQSVTMGGGIGVDGGSSQTWCYFYYSHSEMDGIPLQRTVEGWLC